LGITLSFASLHLPETQQLCSSESKRQSDPQAEVCKPRKAVFPMLSGWPCCWHLAQQYPVPQHLAPSCSTSSSSYPPPALHTATPLLNPHVAPSHRLAVLAAGFSLTQTQSRTGPLFPATLKVNYTCKPITPVLNSSP